MSGPEREENPPSDATAGATEDAPAGAADAIDAGAGDQPPADDRATPSDRAAESEQAAGAEQPVAEPPAAEQPAVEQPAAGNDPVPGQQAAAEDQTSGEESSATEVDVPASEQPEPSTDAPADAEAAAAGSEAPPPPEAPAEPEAAEPVLVRRTLSQELARRLHAAGARFCFTVPGESFLDVLDEFAAVGIRVVTARHEGAASFMAEALAQTTGRPQVVLVTRGVGAANASIGVHTAKQDSAPLVAIVGQVERDFLGREAMQEVDLVGGLGSLASWAAQFDRPEDGLRILDETWDRLHTGRPGPILLSVPADAQKDELDVPESADLQPPGARGPAADRTAVSRVLKLLAASERGVIVAGAGVLRARATKRLVALSEALAVPVIASWRRPDVFPNDHANYLGMTGYWSPSTVPQRLLDADAIMFIGTRMSEVATYGYTVPGPDTQWAHVDIAPRQARAGLPVPTISVTADASRFLDSAWSDLRAAALDDEMRSRRVARNAADREAYRSASDVGQGTWEGPGVHPGRIVAMLRVMLPDNATIATDAGNFSGWTARGFRFRRAGTFLGPTSGSMGFGLPAAIAASLLDPDRIAVAVCGDGGFAMTMADLETAVREGAHPIALVFDNGRYGTIAMHQTREGRPEDSSMLGPVDFAAAARSFGALGFTVFDDDGFESAMREAITSRQTSVIHLRVDPAWVSVDEHPLTIST